MAVPDRTKQGDLAAGLLPKWLDSRRYSAVQRFFLTRLARFLQLRQHQGSLAGPNPQEIRLLDRAIYSTFRDCQAAGVGNEAKELFDTYPSAARS